jgi:membrane protease YdiL (CAAX protease family)
MSFTYEQLFSQAHHRSLLGKVFQFPLVRIVLAVLFMLPFLALHNTVIANLLGVYSGALRPLLIYADTLISFVILLFCYSLYAKWIEKRKPLEISFPGAGKEFGIGFLISFALVGGMVLLLFVLGYYRISLVGSPQSIADAFFTFGFGAFIQVLFFRLILFKLLEELLGSWLAFLLTVAVFSLAHLGNDNATIGTTVAMILTDILMVAAYMYTRRLWLVWGLHFSHNFFQDGIFGMPNSGITDLVSWIKPQISGPPWLTGGAFGIEASALFVIFSFILGLGLLILVIRRDQVVAPVWKRG